MDYKANIHHTSDKRHFDVDYSYGDHINIYYNGVSQSICTRILKCNTYYSCNEIVSSFLSTCNFIFNSSETGFVMTAPVGYAIFSTFSTLQQTLLAIPFALRSMAEARVCFKR